MVPMKEEITVLLGRIYNLVLLTLLPRDMECAALICGFCMIWL